MKKLDVNDYGLSTLL